MNKDGVVEDYDSVTKEAIMKYLADLMESNTRSYQITARKLSSFEDLFVKMSSLHALKILKMSFK